MPLVVEVLLLHSCNAHTVLGRGVWLAITEQKEREKYFEKQ